VFDDLASFHGSVRAVAAAVRRHDRVPVVVVTSHFGREAMDERTAATPVQLAAW